ncbi:MAG: aminopeptidase P family protein [Spirochaetales bacterium]|nr:MAG: aminopeptidase P family protein [Spirochaetales bacterium]
MDWLLSKGFTPEEFRGRRQRVAQVIGRESHALLQGVPRLAGMHANLEQSKQFFYLSGIEIERSYLLISGGTGESTLFVPMDQVGEGHHQTITLSEEDLPRLANLYGFERVLPVDRLKQELQTVSTLFVPHQPAEHAMETRATLHHAARLRAQDEWELAETREARLISLLKRRFPDMTINDLSPTLDAMRLIKSPAEIAVMREAARLTSIVINECMNATEPGMSVHKLSAIGKYVYWLRGQCREGYDFLVTPSTEQSETLVDGDMVLMDGGPDYLNYTTDIARIWPINGRYDEWQRHTYGFIVEYHKTLIAQLKPGVIPQQVYDDSAALMLKRYKDDRVATAMIHNMMERNVRYLNHAVGMSVHDNIRQWHGDPLREGMVIVVDPMVWLEDVPHTYVRVEDTVVITRDGCERLTEGSPLELDDVEALMAQPSQFPM